MNVANKERCQELYALSGWDDVDHESWWAASETENGGVITWVDDREVGNHPAYDLGYLLRRLPAKLREDGVTYWVTLSPMDNDGNWGLEYEHADDDSIHYVWADTPEDAACKLAIELFKQGILKREDK